MFDDFRSAQSKRRQTRKTRLNGGIIDSFRMKLAFEVFINSGVGHSLNVAPPGPKSDAVQQMLNVLHNRYRQAWGIFRLSAVSATGPPTLFV